MSNGELPRFLQLSSALQEFVTVEGTQSQLHIRPLHQYLTVRLVLEGGFDPDEITPHPPLRVESKGARKLLSFAPDVEDTREQTLLGGLKSKAVDVFGVRFTLRVHGFIARKIKATRMGGEFTGPANTCFIEQNQRATRIFRTNGVTHSRIALNAARLTAAL